MSRASTQVASVSPQGLCARIQKYELCCCSQDRLQLELQGGGGGRNRRWGHRFMKFARLTKITTSEQDALALLFICFVVFYWIPLSAHLGVFKTKVTLIHSVFNPRLSGPHCAGPVGRLILSTAPARQCAPTPSQKRRKTIWKTGAFLNQSVLHKAGRNAEATWTLQPRHMLWDTCRTSHQLCCNWVAAYVPAQYSICMYWSTAPRKSSISSNLLR